MKKTAVSIILIVIAVLAGAYFLQSDTGVSKSGIWENAIYTENTQLGNGEKLVSVEVKAENESVIFKIYTDKLTVGDALKEHNLIDGEEGPYGLYVKIVNGIRADYEEDKSYWSFYKNGEPMQTGVDGAEFTNGERFELVYTK